MKKVVSLTISVVLLLFLGTITDSSSGDYIEVYLIEKSEDSLRLTWKQISKAKKYVLYDNRMIIGEKFCMKGMKESLFIRT